jgi:hypothetical protein
LTPVFIGKVQAMLDKRRESNRQQRRGGSSSSSDGIQDPYYEWHRSTETSLDYVVTFDIRPDSGPMKRGVVSRMVPPLLRFGKIGDTEMEFKGEFLEFRIYRDGKLVEPIMPGRLVVEGKEDDKNHRFVDQTHAGSYVYAPDEFLNGGEFRMQIFDARSPGEIHKEVVFTADSKLIKQLRADFSVPQGGLITQTRDIEIGTTKR